MAQYNEILTGRYNRFIQKLFSMKGRPPAPQLSGDIQMQLSFFNGGENRYLEGWNRYMFASNPALGAGIQSASRLRNPANSNVIAVIERVFATSIIAGQVSLEGQATSADISVVAGSPASRLDARGSQASVMVRSETTAVLPGTLTVRQVGSFPANSFFDFIVDTIHELPLLPGDAWELENTVANSQMTYCWMWRERFLEESERT